MHLTDPTPHPSSHLSPPQISSAELNPDCDNNCDNTTTLIHIRSVGQNDEIHYLWDFTGQPAALILTFNDTATLPVHMTINWGKFFDGEASIKINRRPNYYFGFVLQKLFVYNDREDAAHFDQVTDPSDLLTYPLQNFQWLRESFSVAEDKVAVRVKSSQIEEQRQKSGRRRKTGTADKQQPIADIALTFTTYGLAGHSDQIPHLFHTENSTEVDFVLKDLRVARNFSCPRIALGLTMLSLDEVPNGNFSINVRRSLDDEFTPGIFELINVASKGVDNDGFMQYRPVSYTNPAREVSTSTAVGNSELQRPENVFEALNETIFTSIEEIALERAMVSSMNVSFGVAADGCFGKTNYTTWTFVTAYGQPLPERLSTLVVVVAALGLGIPLLLMISGGCYVCLRKAREAS